VKIPKSPGCRDVMGFRQPSVAHLHSSTGINHVLADGDEAVACLPLSKSPSKLVVRGKRQQFSLFHCLCTKPTVLGLIRILSGAMPLGITIASNSEARASSSFHPVEWKLCLLLYMFHSCGNRVQLLQFPPSLAPCRNLKLCILNSVFDEDGNSF